VLAYGNRAKQLIPSRRIDNIELFKSMLSYLNIPYYQNPTMTQKEAMAIIKDLYKDYPNEKWANSLRLHVS
jgi:hypothetical protein